MDQYKKISPNKNISNSYTDIEKELNFEENTSVIPTKLWYSLAFWFSGLIIVGVGYFAFLTFKWLILIATAIIISIALENMILFFTRKLKSRGRAIAISYFIFLAVLISWLIVIVPFIATQVGDLVSSLATKVNELQTQIKNTWLTAMIQDSQIYNYLNNLWINIVDKNSIDQAQKVILDNLTQIITFSSSYVQDAGNILVNIISRFFGALAQISFVIVLSILISVEKRSFLNFVISVSPKKHVVRNKTVKIYDRLSFWLKSQMILGIIIGMVIFVGLWIFAIFGINVPNKFSLAVIAGLTELIPYIGPFLGGIPIALVGTISYGWLGLLLMGGFVILVQQLENNVLIPLLFKKTLGINPIVMFLCAILLGSIAGLNGIILAAPVAIILSIIFEKEKPLSTSSSDKVEEVKRQ